MGPIDPHDAVPIRVLKTLLRMNLPDLRPRVQEAIERTFDVCMQHASSSVKGIFY